MNTLHKKTGLENMVLGFLALCVVVGLFYTGVQALWEPHTHDVMHIYK